jgi:hypothetical protein
MDDLFSGVIFGHVLEAFLGHVNAFLQRLRWHKKHPWSAFGGAFFPNIDEVWQKTPRTF